MICIESLGRNVKINEIFKVYVKKTKATWLEAGKEKRNNQRRQRNNR